MTSSLLLSLSLSVSVEHFRYIPPSAVLQRNALAYIFVDSFLICYQSLSGAVFGWWGCEVGGGGELDWLGWVGLGKR